MIYIVDIDNTICKTPGTDYPNCVPIPERIEKINKLFDEGHEIHYWTARGSGSGLDWILLTTQQLISWGARYTSVKVGKPSYHIWIDDKAIHSDDFFK